MTPSSLPSMRRCIPPSALSAYCSCLTLSHKLKEHDDLITAIHEMIKLMSACPLLMHSIKPMMLDRMLP